LYQSDKHNFLDVAVSSTNHVLATVSSTNHVLATVSSTNHVLATVYSTNHVLTGVEDKGRGGEPKESNLGQEKFSQCQDHGE